MIKYADIIVDTLIGAIVVALVVFVLLMAVPA